MMEADKIENTIKDIFAKHGIPVSRDDPILVLQTINERIMQDSATSQQEMLGTLQEKLEDIAHRWEEDAKDKAEKILKAALTASKEAMAKGMQEGAQAASQVMQREVDAMVAKLAASIREAQWMARMNLVAASLVGAASGLAFWASL